MDIMTGFGPVVSGSSPDRCTTNRASGVTVNAAFALAKGVGFETVILYQNKEVVSRGS